MKGIENSGFNNDTENSQVANEFEMKENNSKDISVNVQEVNSSNDLISSSEVNFIAELNLKARSALRKLLLGDNWMVRWFWIVFTNGIAAGILMATIITYVKKDSPPIDWCEDVGFIWILYIIVYFSLAYYFVKKIIGKTLSNSLKPISGLCETLGSKRYFRAFCYITPLVAATIWFIIFPGKSGRRIFSFLGIVTFLILGFILSKYPGHIKWRPVVTGLILQFLFGLIAIRLEVGKNILECLGSKVTKFLHYTENGASFVYGSLAKQEKDSPAIFAFSVLPGIFFLSLFFNILSYLGALQWVIVKISWGVKSIMGTTVCESSNAAASIFLGMTECPLLIKSYLKDLTESEMCAILCEGWATVAGVVMSAYISFGVKASHLMAASVMSAPAALSYSKLVYPETQQSKTTWSNIVLEREKATNILHAASKGALAGVSIVFGIISNIVAFLSFLAFVDGVLGWTGVVIGIENLSLQLLLSKLFYPISFLMGVEEESLEDVAYLVGIKTVANEFQAYKILGQMIKEKKLSERSEIIATYALCGFSNFASIGITVGEFLVIEPSQASTVTKVALPAFLAANVVCFLTACVAGCLID